MLDPILFWMMSRVSEKQTKSHKIMDIIAEDHKEMKYHYDEIHHMAAKAQWISFFVLVVASLNVVVSTLLFLRMCMR